MGTKFVEQRGLEAGRSAASWAVLGLLAATGSIASVLVVQSFAIRIWPEVALFAPLDSYARAALFTAIPAFGATLVFAWLVQRRKRPVRDFLIISAVLLAFSVIPDYLLPVANRTVLASTIAAVLHVVAAAAIVSLLILGHENWSRP